MTYLVSMLGPRYLRVELDIVDLHVECRDAASKCLGRPPGKRLVDVVGDRRAGRAHFGTRSGSAGEQVDVDVHVRDGARSHRPGGQVQLWGSRPKSTSGSGKPKPGDVPFYKWGPSGGRAPPGVVSGTRPGGGVMHQIEWGIH